MFAANVFLRFLKGWVEVAGNVPSNQDHRSDDTPKCDGWPVDHDVPHLKWLCGGILHFWTHPNQQMVGYIPIISPFCHIFPILLLVFSTTFSYDSFQVLLVISPIISPRPTCLDQFHGDPLGISPPGSHRNSWAPGAGHCRRLGHGTQCWEAWPVIFPIWRDGS